MSSADGQTQWFGATSGRVSGWMGVAAGLVCAIVAAASGSVTWILGGLVISAAVWLVLLRPRVGLRGRTLLLRGIISTWEIPLGLVTEIRARQVLAVWVGETRYVNAALGRPLREVRPRRASRQPGGDFVDPALGEARASRRVAVSNPYVDQVLDLIASHRADAVRWGPDADATEVRRHWAVRELSAITVLVIALVAVAAL